MWNGNKEHFKIGFTSKRIALQRKALIDALQSMGRNQRLELEWKHKSNTTLLGLLDRDVVWCSIVFN